MAEKITAIKGVPLAEVAARGRALVAALPPELVAAHDGQVVAVDIDSGAYEIHAGRPHEATVALRARFPEATIFLARLGRPALETFGAARRRSSA